ncbi:hypothetical protein [uncultured Enterovirga sp.]|uniref:hypothetical protein n=1 Tax=uncultured Enterovirga sp. TaxID=2026352 RepID=UPI0035C98E90
MTRSDVRRRRDPFGALAVLAVVAAVIGTATLVTTASHLGPTTGLAGAGTLVLVYQVPAVIFDWPRITLEAIMDVFGYIGDLISSLWNRTAVIPGFAPRTRNDG